MNSELVSWTKSGLEVDLILGDGEVAIETKSTDRVNSRDLRPLQAFVEEYSPRRAFLVCNERAERVVGPVRITPWKVFLQALWAGEIVS